MFGLVVLCSEKSLTKMLLLEVLAEKLFWVNINQILTYLELDARLLLHEHFCIHKVPFADFVDVEQKDVKSFGYQGISFFGNYL